MNKRLFSFMIFAACLSSIIYANHSDYPGPPTTDQSPYFQNNEILLVDDTLTTRQVGFREVLSNGEYFLQAIGQFSLHQGTILDNRISDYTQNFVGMIMPFAVEEASNLPDGWLECNGNDVAKATYPKLFAKIGTTWGTATDSFSNFRLPDLRGRFVRAVDEFGNAPYPNFDEDDRYEDTDHTTVGSGVGTYQQETLFNHQHTLTWVDTPDNGWILNNASFSPSTHTHDLPNDSMQWYGNHTITNVASHAAGQRSGTSTFTSTSSLSQTHNHVFTSNGTISQQGAGARTIPKSAAIIWAIRYE